MKEGPESYLTVFQLPSHERSTVNALPSLTGGRGRRTLGLMQSVHGTCVAINGHGVLLRGPSGAGKSDLALRLVDGGAALVGDDYCAYAIRDGVLWALPPPTTYGLIEVRGLGIVRLTDTPVEAPVRLVIDLLPGTLIDRLPEIETTDILDYPVRRVALDPWTPSAVAKVRLAVRVAAGDSVILS